MFSSDANTLKPVFKFPLSYIYSPFPFHTIQALPSVDCLRCSITLILISCPQSLKLPILSRCWRIKVHELINIRRK